jgi:HSP20 family protein
MMALVSFDPFESLVRLQHDLDRIFGKPSPDFGLTGPNVFPPINVFSDKDGFTVRTEVPGIKAEDISLDVEPGRLSLSGERKFESHDNDGGYHRRERRGGRFSRTLRLPPDLDTHDATAELRDGILTVRIPKTAGAKPRHIEVKAA